MCWAGGLREDALTLYETVGHLLVWSILAEGLGSVWFPNAVRDPWDITAYCGGAAAAFLCGH